MAVLPRKSGRPKFTRPSPPYVVPRSEKSAWFWLMGNNCPLHRAQPLGGKLNDMIRISDMKCVLIRLPPFSLSNKHTMHAGLPGPARACCGLLLGDYGQEVPPSNGWVEREKASAPPTLLAATYAAAAASVAPT